MITDRAGRYLLAQIPAGRFVLSVPAGPSLDGEGRQTPRLFHPGVESAGGGDARRVDGGQRLELADFRLPAESCLRPDLGRRVRC